MSAELFEKIGITVSAISPMILIGIGAGALIAILMTAIEKRKAITRAKRMIAVLAEIAKDETLLQAEKVKEDEKSSDDAKELARMVLAAKESCEKAKEWE